MAKKKLKGSPYKANEDKQFLDEVRKTRKDKKENILSLDGKRSDVTVREDIIIKELSLLNNSKKQGRVLKGRVHGIDSVEEQGVMFHSAIVNFETFDIYVPSVNFSSFIRNMEGKPDEVSKEIKRHMNNYLGAEIEFVIDKVDAKNQKAYGNRIVALEEKYKKFYLGDDPTIQEGDIVEARVMNAFSSGMLLEVFGLEVVVPTSEVSYNWVNNTADIYSTGDVVPVKILDITFTEGNEPEVSASVKQAKPNPQEEAFHKYDEGAVYSGFVTGIVPEGIFVQLNGIHCLCLYPPKGMSIPRVGADAIVKITRKLEDKLFINGKILRHSS